MERRLSILVEVLSGVYHFLRQQKVPPSELPTLESGSTTPSSSARKRGGGSGTTGSPGEEGTAMSVDGAASSGGEGEAGRVLPSGGQLSELAEKPPLQILGDAEVIEALWSGQQSTVRRLVRRLDTLYSHKLVVETPEEEVMFSA